MAKRMVMGRLSVFQLLSRKAEDCPLAPIEFGSAVRIRTFGKHVAPLQNVARALGSECSPRLGFPKGTVLKLGFAQAQSKFPCAAFLRLDRCRSSSYAARISQGKLKNSAHFFTPWR